MLVPKEIWITYSLQALSTEKFLKTVQKILEGKLALLGPAEVSSDNIEEEGIFLTQN